MLRNLWIVNLRSLDLIKICIPCNVKYSYVSVNMGPSGSTRKVSCEGNLGNYVFWNAKSGLFSPYAWIVSMCNCHKVINKSHKKQAYRIYCLHLEHIKMHTHTLSVLSSGLMEKASHQHHLWKLGPARCLRDV